MQGKQYNNDHNFTNLVRDRKQTNIEKTAGEERYIPHIIMHPDYTTFRGGEPGARRSNLGFGGGGIPAV